MSVVSAIIKLIKRKKKMTEIDNPPTTIQHPVLVAQNERIETLMKANEQLLDEVTKLKQSNEFVSAQLTKWSDKYRTAEMKLTDLLKEMIGDDEISLDNAQRIADIFDNVTLTQRITIRYEIVANVEVEAPFGTDPDTLADETYIDRLDFYSGYADCEVLETDFDIESWNVTS